MTSDITGKPIDRVDGRLKVTGAAKYSAEFPLDKLAYGVAVTSTVAAGHIRSIDTTRAEKIPGVQGVLTYKNSMSLHFSAAGSDPGSGKYAEKDLLPLQSDRIFYDGQLVAVVLADTFELAEYGASLVRVTYSPGEAVLDIQQGMAKVKKPKTGLGSQELQIRRGDAEGALESAAVRVEETYTTPVYHHNAMEPHATIAQWQGDQLLVYDSTQSVYGSHTLLATMLGLEPDKVRVVAQFIGGGFGSKGFSWPNTVTAAMAAKLIGRPVKLVLARQQMFTTAGRRSQTIQKISLGAGADGRLVALQHATTCESSFVDEFIEPSGISSAMLYACPNAAITHQVVNLNRGTPCPMRAPGEATGSFAMEVAMDELAYRLKMDPIELRLLNYAETEQQKKKPFSAKNLRECYERGAVAIGWKDRNPQAGTMRQGNYLVGYGMATATYPANRSASTARAVLFADGHAEIECCTQDIGTGTFTVMTQIAADALGMPIEKVKVKLGDSEYPKGANSGGSQVSASVGPAIRAAALGVMAKFKKLQGSEEGTIAEVLKRNGLDKLEALATTNVSTRSQSGGSGGLSDTEEKAKEESKDNAAVKEDEGVDRAAYAFHSFGAQFVRVLIDPELCTIRVDKAVSVMDIGKVLNLKTAINQIMGGMIFAIGMALMEGSNYDPARGRVVTRDLANYLVPVHADMPDFDIQFIDQPDPYISPIGARGIGEIGITGMSAAVANAVYHATGKRVRDLPIGLEKLMG
ncbi:MAG TPA: xanthine dehydrogenase family protein molybdopterin-binding subunit [Puia sp.]|jgi:xanthine dehydrogenase YagR molybdenum-binding subunit|nr:xanthine dehydrogenase family protein molybdopterin-binding subunit [Puia sp.]